ncbi:apolipoprotein N-acyltransferase [Oceaniglobus indicus]|uniref:apolipoprotein N-acyltransferase n=1 Tax=Oceaniglobus indicus TaxID=2047749 RepID=UPI003B9809BC
MVFGQIDAAVGRSRIAACLTGVAAGLGHVPFSLLPLSLLAFALAFLHLARSASVRQAAIMGWWIGTGYFATTLHWIVEPFLIDLAATGWMAPFALVFMATGFALFWGGAFALAHRISRPGWSRALAFAVCLGGAEMLRSYVLTGFPWALIGYVWSETAGAQIAAWTGSFALGVLTLLGAALAVLVAQRRHWAGAVGLIALWLLPLGIGALRLTPVTQPDADASLIRVVQPNAPQGEKWDPDRAMFFFERQLDFTGAPGEDGRPDLIVWPETAIPFLADSGHPALAEISAQGAGRPVAVGAQRMEGPQAFNSLLVLGQDGIVTDTYDKHHLVPFGEYIPFGGLARLIGLRSFAARDGYGFSAGPGPHLIDFGALGHALPLICYEAIFPQDLRGTPRPDWLLQITNDAWFGTFSGPYQHLAQARMRTIEQGLAMVRVANTGISGLIDDRGRMVAHLPLGQAGFLDVALPPAGPPTPYARSGDMPLAVLLIALCGALWWHRRRAAIDLRRDGI